MTILIYSSKYISRVLPQTMYHSGVMYHKYYYFYFLYYYYYDKIRY